MRIAVANGPDGYDFNDALLDAQAGRVDLKELKHSILGAKIFKRSRNIHPVTMGQFLAMQFPPREYLIEPWLESSSSVMIHGYRGEGKTWFALSVGYALATGEPLMGWKVSRRRTLYIDGELSAPSLQKRLRLLGPEADDLTVLTPDLWHRHHKLMPNLADEATRDWLDQQIEAGGYDVVILDSLSTLIRGIEENDATAWEPIQHWILKHRGHGRSVIFMHHQGKSRKPRGTSKREDIVESVLGLRKDFDLSTDTDSAFVLEFDKAREFYGAAAQPLIIRLSTETGRVEWTCETVRDHTRERIRELWKAGWKQKDIAKEVGLSQPRINQIIAVLRREDHYDDADKRKKEKISV